MPSACKWLKYMFLTGCCLSTAFFIQAHETKQPLAVFEVKACDKGKIRPPGIAKCLSISQILLGKVEHPAPAGRCPEFWQRYDGSQFCMPSGLLVVCGDDTFACRQKPADSFRIEQGPPRCKEGTQPVAVPIPFFDASGELFLQARTGLMCGPLGRGDPL